MGRHHADDGETLIVQRDRLTKNLRRSIESALPNSVADDCERRCAWFVFIFAKDAAHFRSDADDIKEIACDGCTRNALRIAAGNTAQVTRFLVRAGEMLETFRLFLPIKIIRQRDGKIL